MKNIQVLSLLLLLSCGQMYGNANPDLAFVLAYQNIDAMKKNITSDNNDMHARDLLDVMNESIDFDAMQQQALAAAQAGMILDGVPLDADKIAEDNKELQKRIKKLKKNIKKFEKDGVVAWEKKKIDNRRDNRDKKQNELDENLAQLQSMKDAQAAEASIDNIREQNAITFDEALESYIASFGQCYVVPGKVYGTSVIISSNENQNIAITYNEYDQLLATVQKAANQFPSVMITLDLVDSDEDVEVSVADVANYISNMPTNNGSWARFALQSAAIAAVTIGASAVAYNMYQGEDWNSSRALNDASDATAKAYNNALETEAGQKAQALAVQVQEAKNQAFEKALNSPVGQTLQEKMQYAQEQAQVAGDALINSSAAQSVESGWAKALNLVGYQTSGQQANARQETIKNIEQGGTFNPSPYVAPIANSNNHDNSMSAAEEATFNEYFA